MQKGKPGQGRSAGKKSNFAYLVSWKSVGLPSILFIVLCLASTIGLWQGILSEERSERKTAVNVAQQASHSLEELARAMFGTAVSVGTTVKTHIRAWADISRFYNELALDLQTQVPDGSIYSMAVWPLFVCKAAWGPDAGQELGLDALADGSAIRGSALALIQEALSAANYSRPMQSMFYVEGPMDLPWGAYGMRVLLPLVARNVSDPADTFDLARPYSAGCGSACYSEATQTKAWGLVSLAFDHRVLVNASAINMLTEQGYRYRLVSKPGGDGADVQEYLLAGEEKRQPDWAVTYELKLPQVHWHLYLWNDHGFYPHLSWLLVILIVVASALVAGLYAFAEFSRQRHQLLLQSLMPKTLVTRMLKASDYLNADSKIAETGTPAERVLAMVADTLNGSLPKLADAMLVRSALLRGADLYVPMEEELRHRLKEQDMDKDVRRALMRQVGDGWSGGDDSDSESNMSVSVHPFGNLRWSGEGEEAGRRLSGNMIRRSSSQLVSKSGNSGEGAALLRLDAPETYTSMASALAAILSDRDFSGRAAELAAAAGQQPPPRPSQNGGHGLTVKFAPESFVSPSGPSNTTAMEAHVAAAGAMKHLLRTRSSLVGASASNNGLLEMSLVAPMFMPPAPTHANMIGLNPRSSMDQGGFMPPTEEMEALEFAPPGYPTLSTPSVTNNNGGSTSPSPNDREGSSGQHGGSLNGNVMFQGDVSITSARAQTATLRTRRSSGLDLGSYTHNSADMTRPSAQSPRGIVSVKTRRRSALNLANEGNCRPPPPGIVEEVERILARSDEWTFDAFSLDKATQGRPLSTLAFYLMSREGLLKHYNLEPLLVARFLKQVEDAYLPNPYHSKTHAADVLQTLHVCVTRGGMLGSGYADPLAQLAAYFAAVIHDVNHLGVTNDYLVASVDPLAIRYNDKSPMENHHLASAFSVLALQQNNFMHSVPKSQYQKFRSLVIDLVLATDMKQHFSIVSQFSAIRQVATTATVGNKSTIGGRSLKNINATVAPEPESAQAGPPAGPASEAERVLSLQTALKLADMGHIAEDLNTHVKWVTLLEEEFFRQGDAEKAASLPVSPLFDRQGPGATKSQVGFMNIVALPLFHNFSRVFPACSVLRDQALANLRHWEEREAATKVESHGAGSAAGAGASAPSHSGPAGKSGPSPTPGTTAPVAVPAHISQRGSKPQVVIPTVGSPNSLSKTSAHAHAVIVKPSSLNGGVTTPASPGIKHKPATMAKPV